MPSSFCCSTERPVPIIERLVGPQILGTQRVGFCYRFSHGKSLYQFGFRLRIIPVTVGRDDSAVTRLLIADEHEVVRSGLRAILEAQPNWVVVAEAVDGKEAILKAIEFKPDVAVINSVLPLIGGIEVTRQIRMRFRSTEVLVLTKDDSATQIDALVKAGARGFLTTSTPQHGLAEAVQSLSSHKPFLTARVVEELLKSFLNKSAPGSPLSPRERTVLTLVAEGHSNGQTAAILDISIRTVETHLAAIMRKLNLYSRVDLVRYAVRNGVVER
jgi:DNA-binding NarL/FixJ family response regulator